MKMKIASGLAALLIPAFFLAAHYKNARSLPSDLRDAPVSEGAVEELQDAAPAGRDLNQPAVPSAPMPVAGGATGCYAPSNGVEINDQVRARCVRASRILLDSQPKIDSADDIRKANIGQVRGFDMDEIIHCAFTPPPPSVWNNSGQSEKFSCYRTDGSPANGGAGRYYNSKGELVPEAASVGAYGTPQWGLLLNGGGQTLNARADRLKVKYYLGDKRMRECFSETASSRLFWALGIPSDYSFAASKIVCHGCQANPFRARQMEPVSGAQSFSWTSIERSFEGVDVESKADQKGWRWPDLEAAAASSGQMAQYDSLLLASRLVAMNHPKSLQNKIKCLRPDPQTGNCSEIYSIVHDLGSTFGKSNLFSGSRADLGGYSSERVFKDKAACLLPGDYGRRRISEPSRQFFAQRLLSAFGDPSRPGTIAKDRVKMIFQAAHFEGIKDGSLDAWADQLTDRMEEVLAANCAHDLSSDFRDAVGSEGAAKQLQTAAPADQDSAAIPSAPAAESAAGESPEPADAAAQSVAADQSVKRIFSENDPWHKRLAQALGIDYPCTVETRRLGAWYQLAEELTLDDGRRKESVVVKKAGTSFARFVGSFIWKAYMEITSLSKLEEEANSVKMLKNGVEMNKKFRNAGLRTLEIVLTDPENKFVVTKFLKGTDLLTIFEAALRGDAGAIQNVKQVGSALATAHRNNLSVGDLNSGNVMFANGEPYFIDLDRGAVGGARGWDIALFFYHPIMTVGVAGEPEAWALLARTFLQGYLAGGGDVSIIKEARSRRYIAYLAPVYAIRGRSSMRAVRQEMKKAAGEGSSEESDEALGLVP